MHAYQNVIRELLAVSAKVREDRTGVGTTFKVCNHTEYSLELGAKHPIVTTKLVPHVPVIGELLGFIRGADSAATFRELGCNVWNANANKENEPGKPKNAWLHSPWRKGEDDLGRIYGVQWRRWEDTKIGAATDYQRYVRDGYKAVADFEKNGERFVVWHREIDQLQNAVNTIMRDPNSRRIIISAWNPADLDKGALPPCHVIQHYVCETLSTEQRVKALQIRAENEAIWYRRSREEAKEAVRNAVSSFKAGDQDAHLDSLGAPRHMLNLVMWQRSADTILGSPFNIASYSAMITIMARITNTAPGSLHYVTSDTHLYKNHRAAALEQTKRVPSNEKARLIMNPEIRNLAQVETATPDDFRLFNYQHQGKLKNPTPMAI